LYHKEKRYVKQYIREDLIHPQNTIFNLERCYNLQTATGVEKPIKPMKEKKSQAVRQEKGYQQMMFNEEVQGDRSVKGKISLKENFTTAKY